MSRDNPMHQNGGMVSVDLPSERDQLRSARLALRWLAYNRLGPLPAIPGRPESVDMSKAFEGMPGGVQDALKTLLFQT